MSRREFFKVIWASLAAVGVATITSGVDKAVSGADVSVVSVWDNSSTEIASITTTNTNMLDNNVYYLEYEGNLYTIGY